jgi:hypothetical protein
MLCHGFGEGVFVAGADRECRNFEQHGHLPLTETLSEPCPQIQSMIARRGDAF